MKTLRKIAGSLPMAKKMVAESINLEDKLAKCMDWGVPRLSCCSDLTWSCHVKLNTTHSFLNGEVSSGFGHQAPGAAVDAVLDKLRLL